MLNEETLHKLKDLKLHAIAADLTPSLHHPLSFAFLLTL